MMVWFRAYVTSSLLPSLTSRGPNYLHGWKACRERERETGRANNAHLSAPQPFRLFERYTAPAPLLWGHERDKMQELGHKDLQGHLQTRQVTSVFSIASICQWCSRGHLEMNKLVMFTWFHKHYRNPFPLPRSHTGSALPSVRLRNFKYYSWKKLEEKAWLD